jgi:hypothetical protein
MVSYDGAPEQTAGWNAPEIANTIRRSARVSHRRFRNVELRPKALAAWLYGERRVSFGKLTERQEREVPCPSGQTETDENAFSCFSRAPCGAAL